jgi:peptidoglycan/LPS O-acetylase OafA/YrhL
MNENKFILSDTLKPAPDGQNITILDGFRGLAILLVMARHFELFTAGWIGVDLFFVLSGFLVTWKLVQTVDTPNYYVHFYWRRIVRIFPLYIAILLFVFFVFPLLVPSLISNSYRHLTDMQWWYWTFAQNIYTARHGWPENISLIHLWSVAVEVQFYLIWPFVIRFFFKSWRRLTAIMTGLIVFAILFRLFADAFIPLATHYRYVLLPARTDAFSIGALLFLLINRYAGRLKQILLFVALAGTMVNVLFYAVLNIPVNTIDHFPTHFGYTVIDLTFAAWMGYGLLVGKNNMLKQVLTKRLFTSTGRYSYAMYIVHMPLWTMLNRLLENKYGLQLKHEPLLLWTVSLGLAAVVYLIGYISYHKFERYFLRLKMPVRNKGLTHLEPRGR